MTQNIFVYMDFQVAWKREAGKDSTADLYRVVRNRLYRFWKGASLQWTDITAAMVDDFGSSLRAEGLAVNTVKEVSGLDGVKAVIFKSPCIAVVKPTKRCRIDPDRCVHCRTCITEIGCPALVLDQDTVRIDPGLCTGCGLCGQICTVDAIEPVE